MSCKRIGLGSGLLLGVVLALVPGCEGDDKPETKVVEAPYPTFEAFCKGVATAQCTQAIQENCSLSSTTNDQCVAEVSLACSSKNSDITRDIKNTSNYRKDRAEACIAAVNAVYAKAKISKDDHAAIRTACDPVFRGKSGAGFSCEEDIECDEELACYRADLSATTGTCETPKPGVKGDDCSAKGSICGAGLYCSPNDKICAGRPDTGGECSATKPCLESLACTNVSTEGKGVCGAKKASGTSAAEECTSDEECQSSFCALVGSKKFCLDALNFGTGSPVCENFDGK